VLTNNSTESSTGADDYQTSIGQQRQVPGSGPFYLGANMGTFAADPEVLWVVKWVDDPVGLFDDFSSCHLM